MKIITSNSRCTIIFLLSLMFTVAGTQARSKVIMLDPAGDASQRGRTLVNGYERGETLKLAKALETVLCQRSLCEVVIARR